MANQQAKITATGTATCDGTLACSHGPNGIATLAPTGWFAPGLNEFSLVGKVSGGLLTEIGAEPTTVTGTGSVGLAYNDLSGSYTDNKGSFTVTVQSCALVSIPNLGISNQCTF